MLTGNDVMISNSVIFQTLLIRSYLRVVLQRVQDEFDITSKLSYVIPTKSRTLITECIILKTVAQSLNRVSASTITVFSSYTGSTSVNSTVRGVCAE